MNGSSYAGSVRETITGCSQGGSVGLRCTGSVVTSISITEGIGTAGRGCSEEGSVGLCCAGSVETSRSITKRLVTAAGGCSEGGLVGLCCIHITNTSQKLSQHNFGNDRLSLSFYPVVFFLFQQQRGWRCVKISKIITWADNRCKFRIIV